LVRWGFQVLKELLDPPVLKDLKETPEQMGLKDFKETPEQMGRKDLKVMQEQMGLKDLKVMWAHKEHRGQQLQGVIRVQSDHRGQLVLRVVLARLGLWVFKALRVSRVQLETLAGLEILDLKASLEARGGRGGQETLDPPVFKAFKAFKGLRA
jgi:hypothetical protein